MNENNTTRQAVAALRARFYKQLNLDPPLEHMRKVMLANLSDERVRTLGLERALRYRERLTGCTTFALLTALALAMTTEKPVLLLRPTSWQQVKLSAYLDKLATKLGLTPLVRAKIKIGSNERDAHGFPREQIVVEVPVVSVEDYDA